MAWSSLGQLEITGEWQPLAPPLTSTLIRISYSGDIDQGFYQPRAFIRLRIGDHGYSQEWLTIWLENEKTELIVLGVITISANYIEIRKRRDFTSLAANYTLAIEEFQGDPYLSSGSVP